VSADANLALVRGLFEAFARGDLETVAAGFSPDATWRTPGQSRLAGTFRGRDAVMEQLGKAGELSDGGYRVEIRDLMAGAGRVGAYYTGTATRRGRTGSFDIVALYAVADRLVTEVVVAPLDLYAFDLFWA
jgi:ketosteroid isomerase-like protein